MSVILSNDVFEVVVEKINIDPLAVEKAKALLSDDEMARAGRFVFDQDRNRYIVVRARLRQMLADRLGIRPEFVKFDYGKYGKPVLAKSSSSRSLYFNASRSDYIAAYAFSDCRKIGVDVEAVRDMPDINDIVEHCFSDHEIADFRNLDEVDRLTGFFNCWTRKEAFVKAIGEGLSHPLQSFDVSLAPGRSARMLRVGRADGRNCGWEVHRFSPSPGYVGAVVVESPVRKKDK